MNYLPVFDDGVGKPAPAGLSDVSLDYWGEKAAGETRSSSKKQRSKSGDSLLLDDLITRSTCLILMLF